MNLHKASHGFSRGIHEFVASLAGAVHGLDRDFQAEFGVALASQGAMAMGSMNCHPGDPRLLGAFAEHPEALELRGS